MKITITGYNENDDNVAEWVKVDCEQTIKYIVELLTLFFSLNENVTYIKLALNDLDMITYYRKDWV
jgi:hypothetical protein